MLKCIRKMNKDDVFLTKNKALKTKRCLVKRNI